MNGDARADRGAVAFCTHQTEEHAVVFALICVEQQRRRLANVEHNHIDVAAIGDISESRAPSRLQRHVCQSRRF